VRSHLEYAESVWNPHYVYLIDEDTITSLILLMLTMLPSYFWSAPSRHCPPINAFVAPLGL